VNDLLHLFEVTGQGLPPGIGEAIFGLGRAPVERLEAFDVACVFELAGMDAEVAVAGVQQAFKVVEALGIARRQRAHDAKSDALVDQPIQRHGEGSRLRLQPLSRARCGLFIRHGSSR
jgi:hypothetical protein